MKRRRKALSLFIALFPFLMIFPSLDEVLDTMERGLFPSAWAFEKQHPQDKPASTDVQGKRQGPAKAFFLNSFPSTNLFTKTFDHHFSVFSSDQPASLLRC